MTIDPLVKEVRDHRAAILESYGWDFEKMSHAAMQRQWKSGHNVVSRGPRQPEAGASPNAYPIRKPA